MAAKRTRRAKILWVIFTYTIKVAMLAFRVRIHGRESVPKNGPVILASNHTSYIDPPLLAMAMMPQFISFMAKESLFEVPVLGSFITGLGAFPVRRSKGDRQSIKAALAVLKEEGFLGIFPQGARTLSSEIEIEQGVSLLASQGNAQVVPIGIRGAGKVWVGGRFPIRFPRIEVFFGEAITWDEVVDEGSKGKAARQEFSDALSLRISALAGHDKIEVVHKSR